MQKIRSNESYVRMFKQNTPKKVSYVILYLTSEPLRLTFPGNS